METKNNLFKRLNRCYQIPCAMFKVSRTCFIAHQSVQFVKIFKMPVHNRFSSSYFYYFFISVGAVASQCCSSYIGNIAGSSPSVPCISEEERMRTFKLSDFLFPIKLKLNKWFAGACCYSNILINQYG